MSAALKTWQLHIAFQPSNTRRLKIGTRHKRCFTLVTSVIVALTALINSIAAWTTMIPVRVTFARSLMRRKYIRNSDTEASWHSETHLRGSVLLPLSSNPLPLWTTMFIQRNISSRYTVHNCRSSWNSISTKASQAFLFCSNSKSCHKHECWIVRMDSKWTTAKARSFLIWIGIHEIWRASMKRDDSNNRRVC